eukprot:m.11550 g.11550  ORF g.11550 m.11550 type:complete len:89 (+) comp23498_c0_seq1:1238-1504(+)
MRNVPSHLRVRICRLCTKFSILNPEETWRACHVVLPPEIGNSTDRRLLGSFEVTAESAGKCMEWRTSICGARNAGGRKPVCDLLTKGC